VASPLYAPLYVGSTCGKQTQAPTEPATKSPHNSDLNRRFLSRIRR
jgi:hypothetical protein